MKIVKVEDLHCDAGWRVNSFLKITTDEGIVGWSEYMEGYGAQGLTGVILKLAERFLIGQDPRPVERISHAALRRDTAGRWRGQPDGNRRDRERARRHQGQGIGGAGLRNARRPGARPVAALLVALRHLPCAPRRQDPGMGRGRPGALARRHRGTRRGGQAQGLQRAQDQPDPLRPRQALYVRSRHR